MILLVNKTNNTVQTQTSLKVQHGGPFASISYFLGNIARISSTFLLIIISDQGFLVKIIL